MKKERFLAILLTVGLLYLSSAVFAGWSPATRLTWTPGGSLDPAIAIDSSDVIHVVWNEYIAGGDDEIYYRRNSDGGAAWTSPKRLTWTSGASSSPAIAIDSKKGLHVIWYDDTPGNQEIYYRRSLDGGATWDALKRLTWTPTYSYYTAIAVDSNDAIHISWTDNASGSFQIYYRKSTDRGSSWGEIQRLTWTSGASFGPAIAVDSKNHIHIVCEDYITGGDDIYYTRSTTGGETWSPLKRLTWTSTPSANAAVAVGAGDSVHVAWEDSTSGQGEIYAKKSPDGGATWSANKRLTWTSGSSYGAALDVDSGGAIHLVWSDNTAGNYDIDYKKSADGGTTWSGVQRLTWNSGDSRVPSMAVDSSHTVHIVWMDLTPGNYEVYYKKGT